MTRSNQRYLENLPPLCFEPRQILHAAHSHVEWKGRALSLDSAGEQPCCVRHMSLSESTSN